MLDDNSYQIVVNTLNQIKDKILIADDDLRLLIKNINSMILIDNKCIDEDLLLEKSEDNKKIVVDIDENIIPFLK